MSKMGEEWSELQNQEWPPEEDEQWIMWAEEQQEAEDGKEN